MSATPFAPGGRLERFRAARTRLDPAGDPADATAFYVDTPHAVSSRIAAELALAPASSHLLVGGVGSGKTTELLAIERRMTDVKDVVTLYVDVSKQHDIARLASGALAEDVGHGLAERMGRRFTGDTRPWDSDLPNPMWPELQDLLEELRASGSRCAVLVDGLDRLVDIRDFERVIHSDVNELIRLGVGVVLVGPLRAMYGIDRALVQRFDGFHYQPWIDVSAGRDGRDFLIGVLTRRAADMFDPQTIASLVASSGGVLRDLLSLSQSALVETYMNGSERVGPREVASAIDAFGRKHMQGLRPAELTALRRVLVGGDFIQTSEDDLALLMTRRVLEYRTDNRPRYALHPTIELLVQALL